MKRLAIGIALLLMIAAPALFAQGHVQVGAYGDYFRYGVPGGSANLFGVGGNILFKVANNVQVGGDIAYDWEQGFNVLSLTDTNFHPVSSRIVRGLFGPEIKSSGSFRPFATIKGGFINWNQVSPDAGVLSTFGLGTSTHFALYPGGGIEAFAGPIGLRVEVGDFIYWNNGAHNNLRVAFGPEFRF